LGAGLLAKDTWVVRNYNDLTLSWGTDSVYIPSFFSGSAYQVESFKFDDGTTWGLAEIAQRQNGTASADRITGLSEFANTINGLAGDDTLSGGSKNDALNGGDGNDNLSGGMGNDTLTGSSGKDTYFFNLGDGADTVNDHDTSPGNLDTLKLGTGLLAANTLTSRSGNDLKLTWYADSVTVQNYFSIDAYNRVENIEFADGMKWTATELAARLQIFNGTTSADNLSGWSEFANTINGLAGNDTLSGGSKNDVLDGGDGNDILLGGAGNDSLYGVSGNDNITGGTGNDFLSGRWGNDTYIFNQGDGADTISDQDWTAGNKDTLQLGAGLLATDTWVVRNQGNLTLSWGTDSVYIPSFFSGSAYQVESFKFDDGTTWSLADIAQRQNGTAVADRITGLNDFANTINGLAGNDTLTGGSKNDVLNGGDGNDNLSGGMGNDTLTGSSGKDTLTGGVGADKFVLSNSPTIGNSDVLTDFMASQGDQMLFDTSFFAQLSGKSDLTNHIRKYSAKSVGSDDYIVYDNTTGNLYYDPTGLSNANAVLIANLQNKPLTMAANQFVVL
jgi:Ca2+-binding RTX toxin-like protein